MKRLAKSCQPYQQPSTAQVSVTTWGPCHVAVLWEREGIWQQAMRNAFHAFTRYCRHSRPVSIPRHLQVHKILQASRGLPTIMDAFGRILECWEHSPQAFGKMVERVHQTRTKINHSLATKAEATIPQTWEEPSPLPRDYHSKRLVDGKHRARSHQASTHAPRLASETQWIRSRLTVS